MDNNTVKYFRDPTFSIVKFTNGSINTEDNHQALHFKNDTQNNKQMIAETNHMQYSGKLDNDENYRYLIGIHNKNTGKICIHEANKYTFRPMHKGISDDEEEETIENEKSIYEKVDSLTKTFGSLKRKRQLFGRFTNKVSKENLSTDMGEVVKDAMNSTELNTTLNANSNTDKSTFALPPYKENATTGPEAYPLDKILSESDMKVLKESVTTVIDYTPQQYQTWTQNKTFSKYVLSSLERLPLDEPSRSRSASLLLYIQYLTGLVNSYKKDLLKGKITLESEVPFCVPILNKLFSEFTIQSGNKPHQRSLSSMLKSKAICHALVLALIREEYCLDYLPFLEDLNLSESRLTKYLSVIGCRKKSRGTTVMELKLPLVVVKKKRPSNKSRRK